MSDAETTRCAATKVNGADCRQRASVMVGPIWVCRSHESALESWAWRYVAEHQRQKADQVRATRRARKQTSIVYYVHGAASDEIKIGWTTGFRQRLPALRTEYPNHGELTLLAWHRGDDSVERIMHRRFDDDRVQGEWFLPSDELLAHIAKIQRRHVGQQPADLAHHGLWPTTPRRRCGHEGRGRCPTCISLARGRAKQLATA